MGRRNDPSNVCTCEHMNKEKNFIEMKRTGMLLKNFSQENLKYKLSITIMLW
jgi:hypothetical protein